MGECTFIRTIGQFIKRKRQKIEVEKRKMKYETNYNL